MMLSLNKKIVALASALIISTTSSVALAYTPLDKDYHTPTSREELEDLYSSNYLNKMKAEKQLVKSAFLENKIRNVLVKYNSKLKIATNDYDDGLRDVYISRNPNSTEESASNISSYIYISKIVLDNITKNHKDYNIYGLSAIANIYAHESGHWYYNDTWTPSEQKDRDIKDLLKTELRADKFAYEMLNNVPEFNVGGAFIDVSQSAKTNGWYTINNYDHPSNGNRWDDIYKYIKAQSDNRVVFDEDKMDSNELLVANSDKSAYYTVYTPEQTLDGTIIATNYQRAYFVSGAISWAIHNNAWNSKSVKFEDAHKYFNDLPANVSATAIIATASNGKYKIIDWYQNDKAETTEKQYLDNLKASYQN